jgi:hypothetical protein
MDDQRVAGAAREERRGDLRTASAGQADEQHLGRRLVQAALGLRLGAEALPREPLGENVHERRDAAGAEALGRLLDNSGDGRTVVDPVVLLCKAVDGGGEAEPHRVVESRKLGETHSAGILSALPETKR